MQFRSVDGNISVVALARFLQNDHGIVDRTALMAATVPLAPCTDTADLGDSAGKSVTMSGWSNAYHSPRTQ